MKPKPLTFALLTMAIVGKLHPCKIQPSPSDDAIQRATVQIKRKYFFRDEVAHDEHPERE